jgi:hypothetical protein
MAITKDHELHVRRRKRNLWVGLMLVSFVALVFGITVAKMSDGEMMEAFDGCGFHGRDVLRLGAILQLVLQSHRLGRADQCCDIRQRSDPRSNDHCAV